MFFLFYCSQIVHNTEYHLKIFDHLFTSQAREIQPELNGEGVYSLLSKIFISLSVLPTVNGEHSQHFVNNVSL